MNRILLLMAFSAALVAAGRITVNPDRVQGIDRLSLEDLQRQKFILDIVQNIQQPLQQSDLIQLDQGLIVDSQRYRGGIDVVMQRVIDLDRQRRLLDEHQVYSVGRLEDVQQLRGIYRLLVRAQDFDTLRRNVVYLRRNINPVLLVNALALAIRDREDTRNLIVPAVQELLPELYLDEEVIEQVRGVLKEQTQRPTLMDIVGLRQNTMNPMMNILMPWRQIHMQMALLRQQQQNRLNVVGQKRVVIRADNQEQIEGTSLLTDDIELSNLVQNLIQELALLEDDTQEEQSQRISNVQGRNQLINSQQDDEDQWIGQSQWNTRQGELGQNVNTGRLLHVNRRRLQEQQNQEQGQNIYGSQRQRFQQLLRRDEDNDNDDDDDDDIRVGRVQLQRGISQGGLGIGGTNDLPTVSVNSDRLLHVSRRRLNAIQQEQQQDQQQYQQTGRQRFFGLGGRLSEGRRVGQLDEVRQMNDWQIKRQRQILGLQDDQEQDQDQYQIQAQKQGRRLGVQQQGQSYADQLESVERDDDRLVHINRRRLNQDIQQQQQQQQRITPRRIGSIGEGRRVMGDRLIQDEDILKLIRSDNRLTQMTDEEILEMLKRNRLQKQQNNDSDNNDDDDDDNDDDDEVVERRQGLRSRRSLTNLRQQNSRRGEIILHNLRQLVARLNQESISQGETIDQTQQQQQQLLNNPRLTQTERYNLRLNKIRIDSQRNREILGQIGQIEQQLQQVIAQVVNQVNVNSLRGQVEDQRQVESLIADVLLGRLGQVGIINIIREVVQDNKYSGQQIDRTGLGIRLSDPVVQHTLRRIVKIVDQQREQILGAYRQEQLQMRGVSINDVRVDKLRTRIEEQDLDLSNLVEQQQQQIQGVQQGILGRQQVQGVQQEIVGRQRRLNNKDFTIDLEITSDEDRDAIVRVFLGPGEDQQGRQGVSLEQRRRDFVLLDAINVQLENGRNRVQLRSIDIPWTKNDVTPVGEIYRQVMTQLKGQQQQLVMGGNQELVGENGRFPQHLLLPRGRPQGLPMQLLVVVSPLVEQEVQEIVPAISIGIGSASLQDIRPLGFPLDRPIRNEQELLQLPNVLLQDVTIVQEN
ncbi:fat-body protein 1 [Drosophila subpulchrella]|uniref:fat-body protein 1 n=1 Tax=Drosophila subpulchrella TaxID=1486046 RepID=UPI0018A19C83|nr:fat-body protein 1 [Drosophila subpulchrella]